MHASLKVAGSALACALAIQGATAFAGPDRDARDAAQTPRDGAVDSAASAPGSGRSAPERRGTKDAIERMLVRALAGETGVAEAPAATLDGDAFYDGDSDMLQSSCESGEVSYIAESCSATSGVPSNEGWLLLTKGALLRMHDFGSERSVISVRARSRFGGGAWPRLVVTVDGETIGETLVDSAAFADYRFGLIGTGAHEIGLWFDNDYYDKTNDDDRNLYIDSVSIAPICR